jgi:hypothetical protein
MKSLYNLIIEDHREIKKLNFKLCCSQQLTASVNSGTGVPTSTPSKIGDLYVDTTNLKLYFATGTTSSSDWTIAN